MPASRPQRPNTGVALTLPRVSDEDSQRAFDGVSANVRSLTARIGAVATSVESLSSASSTWINVQDFGAKGNGTTNDAVSLQKAITDNPGKTLFFPRGKYLVTTTLLIADRSTHMVGDFGNRNTDNGTEIVYTGTGPCIQIGVDNGLDWDLGLYNGPQDHLFDNLHISHGAPDTALVSAGDATPRYKAGAYGIWDWRGGGVVTRNVGIEGFEANFVAIESDFDDLELTVSLYSKYGIYIGPRSDQCTIRLRDSFFCDRCITVDGARVVRILEGSFVGSGTPTSSPIEIRRASGQVTVPGAWFEHLQGYAGTDQQSLCSVGEVNGYGSGGSIQSSGGTPNTLPVESFSLTDPFCYVQSAGNPNHTKYIITVGKCKQLMLHHPAPPPGVSLSNFDAMVAVQAGQAPTNAETQIRITGVNSNTPFASLYTNLGGGNPTIAVWANGISGTVITDEVTCTKDFKLTNEVSAPLIGANQNDYSPTGLDSAFALLIASSAAFDITGFATGTTGRLLWVFNIGGFAITLKHQVTSSPVNRIIGRGYADTVVGAGSGTWLYYSGSQSRWIVMTNP